MNIDPATLLIARDRLLESGWNPDQDTQMECTSWLPSEDRKLACYFPHWIRETQFGDLPFLSPALMDALLYFGIDPSEEPNRGGLEANNWITIDRTKDVIVDPLIVKNKQEELGDCPEGESL